MGATASSGASYPSDWDQRRRRVYERDGWTCQNCGARGGDRGDHDEQHSTASHSSQRERGDHELHAHHVVPKSNGGSHALSNLTTLCGACHNNAHDHYIPHETPSALHTSDHVESHSTLASRQSRRRIVGRPTTASHSSQREHGDPTRDKSDPTREPTDTAREPSEQTPDESAEWDSIAAGLGFVGLLLFIQSGALTPLPQSVAAIVFVGLIVVMFLLLEFALFRKTYW